MTSSLGLNDHHQAQVLNYMRFARYHRSQQLRAIDVCFEELKDSRLNDETYTVDEVTEMLDGLLILVRGDMESELINMAHTNILLLRQMFQQAEKWHLKLQSDISELENRELLEQIKNLEEKEFSGAKKDSGVKVVKLEPLNETGAAALLHKKIEELQQENTKLLERLKKVEGQALSIQQEKDELSKELIHLESQLGKAYQNDVPKEEIDNLERQIADLHSMVDMKGKTNAQCVSGLETDLIGTKHELLRVQDMLEMAEKELEKKVSQTTPFKNLKTMLQKKNEQLKELRRRFSKYDETLDE